MINLSCDKRKRLNRRVFWSIVPALAVAIVFLVATNTEAPAADEVTVTVTRFILGCRFRWICLFTGAFAEERDNQGRPPWVTNFGRWPAGTVCDFRTGREIQIYFQNRSADIPIDCRG